MSADDELLRIDLLPDIHPLRNAPLVRIRAEYQWRHTKRPDEWHQVRPGWHISACTFNDLGLSWTANYIWRAKPHGVD